MRGVRRKLSTAEAADCSTQLFFDYGLPLSSDIMLRYAIIFLIVALIAEAFGFSGVAGEASWIAHVLLVVAVIFIVVSFVTGRRGPPAV